MDICGNCAFNILKIEALDFSFMKICAFNVLKIEALDFLWKFVHLMY